jgi:drug/metabolite transporter (DMT)-like permease
METKWLLVLMVSLGVILALTQIFLKRFLVFYNHLAGGFWERIPPALGSHLLWITVAGFLISVVLWLWVLPRVRLAVVYPMISLSYVAMLFLAHFLEGEPIHWPNIAGVMLIVGGVILLAWSK